ncbi:hypothetical protein EV193_1011068 [Herbihabitans rhizosphaerae]|uniref:Uncharacterized protein n=1 Tax=Herbihabitans rhizosphaerae TaxID=1872711 RepID=A0A4Q7L921_9PSEU|nr:hypothetical protein [Herbihabitans rhizosphaerae]RZS45181.1 hypothetical protein EV193_1011068 [Herbihabitans rhizosphaerae]
MTDDKSNGVPEEQQGDTDASSGEPPRRGSISFQDADTTQARQPTVAEQRARERAIQREERDARLAVVSAEEKKSTTRRRIMIGSGVTVGLVALVATSYNALEPDEVYATCVDDKTGQAVDDKYCDESYIRSSGGHYDSGGGFFFIGGFGGPSYHHSYGNNRYSPGQSVPNYKSSYSKPSGSTIKTSGSGKTIQRGGFGVKSSGSSGKSGGS